MWLVILEITPTLYLLSLLYLILLNAFTEIWVYPDDTWCFLWKEQSACFFAFHYYLLMFVPSSSLWNVCHLIRSSLAMIPPPSWMNQHFNPSCLVSYDIWSFSKPVLITHPMSQFSGLSDFWNPHFCLSHTVAYTHLGTPLEIYLFFVTSILTFPLNIWNPSFVCFPPLP